MMAIWLALYMCENQQHVLLARCFDDADFSPQEACRKVQRDMDARPASEKFNACPACRGQIFKVEIVSTRFTSLGPAGRALAKVADFTAGALLRAPELMIHLAVLANIKEPPRGPPFDTPPRLH